jgi:hypothetical protein
MSLNPDGTVRRGTSNGNERGSSETRRKRRVWLIETYASNVPGFARCYRCGRLVYNPDDYPGETNLVVIHNGRFEAARPLTVDRIKPGCEGGRYVNSNIRPACGYDNASTGSKLARRGKARK